MRAERGECEDGDGKARRAAGAEDAAVRRARSRFFADDTQEVVSVLDGGPNPKTKKIWPGSGVRREAAKTQKRKKQRAEGMYGDELQENPT